MRIEGSVSTPVQMTQAVENKTSTPREINKFENKQDFESSTSNNQRKEANEEEIINAIEMANKSVKTYDRKLEFSIHDKTKQIMVKVIDTSGTEEKVIREIPPEKVLDMVAKLWEVAGILVDEKA